MKKKRMLILIDIFRGIAILNMIAYHLLYDLVYIFEVKIPWFTIEKTFIWEQYICFSFILISGISMRCSRTPWKNGIKLMVFACILTIVTYLVIPSQTVWFGVLHMLAAAMLVTSLLLPVLKKISALPGLAASFFIFLIVKPLPQGFVGVKGIWELSLPQQAYHTDYLFWLGFPRESFASSDYFPVIPWLFLFLTGYFIGEYWIRLSEWFYGRENKLTNTKWYCILDDSLGFVGRKSLFIYLIHQPAIYGFLLIMDRFDFI